MALRLVKMCGNGGQSWFALQTGYELRRAEAELAADLEQIPTLMAA